MKLWMVSYRFIMSGSKDFIREAATMNSICILPISLGQSQEEAMIISANFSSLSTAVSSGENI